VRFKAHTLLDEMRRRGVTVRVRDGRLFCKPLHQIPPSIRGQIRQYRDELIGLLFGPARAKCPENALAGTSKTSESPPGGSSAGFAGTKQGPFRDITPPLPPNSLEAKRPRWPCRGCGSVTYWAAKGGTAWVCEGCRSTDLPADEVQWLVVEDARRITAVTRPKIGCTACKFSGFVYFVDGRWTVCRCNDGFERHVESEQEGGGS